MHPAFLFAFLLAAATLARAQVVVDPARAEAANRAFTEAGNGERLNCAINSFAPFLDFAFRFEAGYTFECPIRIFEGKPATMMALVKVTPENQAPVLFTEKFKVPGIPDKLQSKTDVRQVNAHITGSGVLALGEGRYTVEVVLRDDQDRRCRKRWDAKAQRSRQEQKVAVSLPPQTASALAARIAPDVFQRDNNGVRLTVLLDAAPIYPHSQTLRAWDQAFLLDSVTSVLRRVPYRSVRLVAFNVDQQREIFRDDHFDRDGLIRLAHSLRKLELSTVSYHVLSQPSGGVDLLSNLSRQEVTASEPSDAVMFVGPALLNTQKVKLAAENERGRMPKFFYLQYFPAWRRGREFPDTLQYLTSQHKGTVLKIHSPGELAQALHKVREELRIKADPTLAGSEEASSTK